jgi:solute carrier family 25 phosphate transporter 3
MPLLYPTQGTLNNVFIPQLPFSQPKPHSSAPSRTRYQSRSDLFPTWSVVEDAKTKTKAFGDAAVKDIDQASAKTQAKVGKIELYSPKYYAACISGGLLACVSKILDSSARS